MSRFSKIGTKPTDSTEETTVAAANTETTGTDSAWNTDDMISFMGQARELKGEVSTDEHTDTDPDATGNDAPPTTDDPEVSEAEGKNQNWFQRMFGGRTDGPGVTEADTEMDDEMYQLSGGLGAEISNEAVPRLISVMNDDTDHRKYQATDDQKGRLARAWEIYLRSLQKRITPLQYLIGVHATIYGARLFGGLFSWFSRVQLYGFHFPWSQKWKLKAAKMAEQMNAAHEYMNPDSQQQAQADPPPEPAQPPAPEPEPATSPEPPMVHVSEEEQQECMYWQLKDGEGVETPRYFPKGKGYPRSSKNHKDLVGKFSTGGAFISYLNATKVLGRKK